MKADKNAYSIITCVVRVCVLLFISLYFCIVFPVFWVKWWNVPPTQCRTIDLHRKEHTGESASVSTKVYTHTSQRLGLLQDTVLVVCITFYKSSVSVHHNAPSALHAWAHTHPLTAQTTTVMLIRHSFSILPSITNSTWGAHVRLIPLCGIYI